MMLSLVQGINRIISSFYFKGSGHINADQYIENVNKLMEIQNNQTNLWMVIIGLFLAGMAFMQFGYTKKQVKNIKLETEQEILDKLYSALDIDDIGKLKMKLDIYEEAIKNSAELAAKTTNGFEKFYENNIMVLEFNQKQTEMNRKTTKQFDNILDSMYTNEEMSFEVLCNVGLNTNTLFYTMAMFSSFFIANNQTGFLEIVNSYTHFVEREKDYVKTSSEYYGIDVLIEKLTLYRVDQKIMADINLQKKIDYILERLNNQKR